MWALTAGDDPALRTTAVAGVVALTIVGIAIRFAHRTIREQRGDTDGDSAADSAPRFADVGSGGPPDSYQELLHQLDAASRSPSYLRSVVVPRLQGYPGRQAAGARRQRGGRRTAAAGGRCARP